jgi:hypothetical protein
VTVASCGRAGPRRALLRPSPVAEALPALHSVRLLDRIRERIRLLQFSHLTEEACVHWCRTLVRFHGIRHSAEIAARD